MELNWKNLGVLAATLVLAGSWIAQGQADSEVVFPMPPGPLYVKECGSCHTAYAPGLLPARSWQKMMAELDNHFGEDASLEEPERLAILRWLVDYAADGANANLLMRRIAASIPRGAMPQRITETPLFKFQHDEVPAHIWKRPKIGSPANCGACHTRANEGRYPEREVRIPK
ncbi:MAG: diheme cytochrome c [Thiobacillaceae bacterium]|nr:diheme cytochrome c [Thiobacillaceae bacterium]MCX7672975.1 diheme cytochrome c [Thiobacillaceae bacterium]MDW8324522.1 diheme cytochrome c [Burkholderiales bacterium]